MRYRNICAANTEYISYISRYSLYWEVLYDILTLIELQNDSVVSSNLEAIGYDSTLKYYEQ